MRSGSFYSKIVGLSGATGGVDSLLTATFRTIKVTLEEGALIVALDESPGNVINDTVLTELGAVLTYLERAPAGIRALVLRSRQPNFSFGANIRAFPGITHDQAAELSKRGQELTLRLENLRIPTIAVLDGYALGGGWQLALACDVRVAAQNARMGLPETEKLGIVPGWGGTQRVVRLVRQTKIAEAVELLYSGKQIKAQHAADLGLVDFVFAEKELAGKVSEVIKQVQSDPDHTMGRRQRMTKPLVLPAEILHAAREKINAPEFPSHSRKAALTALDILERGAFAAVREALPFERDAFATLLTTRQAQALSVDFLTARGQAFGREAMGTGGDVRKVIVVGAGVMGARIAQVAMLRIGVPAGERSVYVVAKDRRQASVASMLVRESLQRAHSRGELQTSVEFVFDRAAWESVPMGEAMPPPDVSVVFEAVTEDRAVKREVLRDIWSKLPSAIILSNTDAIDVFELAREVAAELSRPELAGQIAIVRFMNPAHRQEVVEVVIGERTPLEVQATIRQVVRGLGKIAVFSKNRPGFFSDRVLLPYGYEALRMLEEGVPPEWIDGGVTQLGKDRVAKMGPLEVFDMMGLDHLLSLGQVLEREYGDTEPWMRVPALLGELVAAGNLGSRGRGQLGIYEYDRDGKKSGPNSRLPILASQAAQQERDRGGLIASRPDLARKFVRGRLLLQMIREAAMVLEEGIISHPAWGDRIFISGMGFLPEAGGPFSLADGWKRGSVDKTGIQAVVRAMREYTLMFGPRFEPPRLLLEMAEGNPDEGSFYTRYPIATAFAETA